MAQYCILTLYSQYYFRDISVSVLSGRFAWDSGRGMLGVVSIGFGDEYILK